jgi:hypothetical protein
MSLDLGDVAFLTALNHNNYTNMRDESLKMRAQGIQDSSGVKPESLEEYRGKHGGLGFLKGLVYGALAAAAVGGGIALAATSFTALVGLAVPAAIVVAAVVPFLTMASQSNKTAAGYTGYLNGIASRIRNARGQRPLAVDVEYDVPARQRSFAEEVSASKQVLLSGGRG